MDEQQWWPATKRPRRLWPAVHRRVRRALLARLAERLAPGAAVREITVEIERRSNRTTADLVYHLEARPDTGGALAFQIPSGMAPVRRVECEVSSELDPWHGESRIAPDLLLLESAGDRTWDGAEVRFRIEWPPASANSNDAVGTILLLPDVGPRLLRSYRSPAGGLQPRIQLSNIGEGTDWFAAVGALGEGTLSSELGLLQVAIVPSERVAAATGSTPVSISRKFLSQLQPSQEKGVKEQIANMLTFLARSFGVAPPLRVGVVLPSEPRGVRYVQPGACFPAKPYEFGYGPRPGGVADINLSSRLASIWWGAGCRILGERGQDIATGICTGMGLHWATVLGETEKVGSIRQGYQRIADATALKNAWKVFTEDASSKLVTALALSVHDAIVSGGPLIDSLRTLTQQSWGRFLGAKEVIARLNLSGKYGDLVQQMVGD